MNACKVLDLTPASAMSSWGTIHFPEERRMLEFLVTVRGGKFRILRYGACLPEPQGGFADIKEGHEAYLKIFEETSAGDFRAEMLCKEGLSADAVVRLVLGELPKVGFPFSLAKEEEHLRARLAGCGDPAPKAARRFRTEGR